MGLTEITARVRAAEAAAGRTEGSVRLIAVSKVQPPERVEAVLRPATGCSARIMCKRRRGNGPPGGRAFRGWNCT